MSNTVFTDAKHISIGSKQVLSIHDAESGKLIWGQGEDLFAPLKFTATQNTSLIISNREGNAPVLYKSADGNNWDMWDYTPIPMNSGDVMYIKGDNPNGFSRSASKRTTISADYCLVEGSVMSLLGDRVIDIPSEYCFAELFAGSLILSAPSLPAKSIKGYCYQYMFSGCKRLVDAPNLPATSISGFCYYYMFRGCTSLVNAPALPATKIASFCYTHMFEGCTSLVNAPALPAMTLREWCYGYMFRGCTSLVNAPELPAKTLVHSCYDYMFYDCKNLNSIKCLAEAHNGDATSNWLLSASVYGIFTKKKDVIWPSGTSGIPVGWTVEEI